MNLRKVCKIDKGKENVKQQLMTKLSLIGMQKIRSEVMIFTKIREANFSELKRQ